MKPKKLRLDVLLVDRGLVESREKGQALILSGQVLVNNQKVEKAGALVPEDADIRIIGEQMPYVSRGGLKLEAALREFHVSVEGKTALDVGASTGGFTDCLLQHGCKKVFAVDVGYGQMAWKLRQDPRVFTIERTNIREIGPSLIPGPVDIAVIDVSFISLEKVIPPVMQFLRPGSEIIALINEMALLSLQAPIERVTGFDIPVPLPKTEHYYLPNPKRIIMAVKKVMNF